jgi:hypothetical protein
MIATAEELVKLTAAPVEIKWHSALPIFASEPFLKTVGKQYGWLGGMDASGRVRCAIPYAITRVPGFRMARFRVETMAFENDLSLEEEESFLASSVEYFRSIGADMILPASNTALLRTFPPGTTASPYGTVVNDLAQPEEQLRSKIHKSCSYNIRSAQKAGVQIKSGPEYLDTCYQLIAETMKRSGLSFRTRTQFDSMVSGLGENVRVMVADLRGVVQGCMIAPFSQHTAYSWYCGTKVAPARGSMHLLHWEAMRQFRELGTRRFNFTGVRINPEKGSKQDGIRNFKLSFGGDLVEGYIWRYPISRLRSAAFSAALYLFEHRGAVRLHLPRRAGSAKPSEEK